MSSSTTLAPEGKATTPKSSSSSSSSSTSDVDRLRAEVEELRRVVGNHPEMWESYYHKEAARALRNSVVFRDLDEDQLEAVARRTKRQIFPRGSMIARQGLEWRQPAFFFASGEVERWTDIDGVHCKVKSIDTRSVGSMHLLLDEATRFSVQALTDVVAYGLTREDFAALGHERPDIFHPIAHALAAYIRTDHRQVTSGLFEQKGNIQSKEKSAYIATSLAVFVEAFYRSAMNNVMNAQLDGKPIGRGFNAWFPQMHVQVPTRIIYITGLKEIRRFTSDVDTHDRMLPQGLMRLGLAIMPGVVMCPLSSILEATHSRQNTEPMSIRWTRGVVPRFGREIVFGIGINQLSDYCREHAPSSISNQALRTSFGSVTAGILAGYFSQIPHNISTMKLMDPSATYGELWKKLWTQSMHRVPQSVQPEMREMAAQTLALLLPLGSVRRSIQIGGSFVIINGLLYRLRDTFPF